MREATLTVRLPAALKRRLAARANRQRRSVSAQVVCELERALGAEPGPGHGQALGMFPIGPVPTTEDFEQVRALLWGGLGRRHG